jgi:protein SCO1
MTDSPPPRTPRSRSGVRWALFGVLFGAATLGAVFAGLYSTLGGIGHAFHGTPYPEHEPAPTFTLTDHRGEQVSLDDFEGEAVLLFFGFTHCPDVCPLTLSRLSGVLAELGRRGEGARILLITVDPERDTPSVLARYVERFGPHVTGLTGEAAALEALRRQYGVYAEVHAHGDAPPMVVHTDAVFGIDRRGRLRVLLHPDGPLDQLRADLRTLLRS